MLESFAGFVEVKEAEANEQHESVIGALKAAAPKWEFQQKSGECVLPPAGASRYKANYRGIEGEHRAQCARVRR